MSQDNPYDRGTLLNYLEGDQSLERKPVLYTPSVGDRFHIIKDTDQLDGIAFKYYKNSKLWWLIADVNSIFNPFELTTGDKLIIPDLNVLTKV